MSSKITIILILSLFILSCGEKNNKKQTTNSLKKIEKVLTEKCKCYDGIGSSENDLPILTFAFSNGKSVSVCGYKNPDSKADELLISEFNVFDCLNGKQFVEYGAMENCLIKTGNDTIKIQLLRLLPVGEDWKWTSVEIAEQIITTDLNELKISELTTNYSPIEISNDQQSAFFNNLQKGQGFNENWEDILGKLEVLSLNGNEKAWKILKNYDDFTGFNPDGALSESWKAAIATVEWITNKK